MSATKGQIAQAKYSSLGSSALYRDSEAVIVDAPNGHPTGSEDGMDVQGAVTGHLAVDLHLDASEKASSSTILTLADNTAYSLAEGDELVQIDSGGGASIRSVLDALSPAVDSGVTGVTTAYNSPDLQLTLPAGVAVTASSTLVAGNSADSWTTNSVVGSTPYWLEFDFSNAGGGETVRVQWTSGQTPDNDSIMTAIQGLIDDGISGVTASRSGSEIRVGGSTTLTPSANLDFKAEATSVTCTVWGRPKGSLRWRQLADVDSFTTDANLIKRIFSGGLARVYVEVTATDGRLRWQFAPSL